MVPKEKLNDPLTRKVIGEAMYVHRTLGPGFLESIYQTALLIKLRKAGIAFECQKSLPVCFEDEVIGNFLADLVIEGRLIVELKSVSCLTSLHEAQLVNYLAASKIDVGLLLNFGALSLEFKRKYRFAVSRNSSEPIYLNSPHPEIR